MNRFALIVVLAVSSAHSQVFVTVEHPELRSLYDSASVSGCFYLYDGARNRAIVYNPSLIDRPFIPASTYKIIHSMIALETKVIPDEHTVLRWDGVKRQNPNWNHDQDMQEAFQNSTVWYYQELARRIGARREKFWMDTVNYGNRDTTGGFDRFWLTGNLRITPREQVRFLLRLQHDDLPFSQRTLDIVKRIMVATETPTYILRAKTGWSDQDGVQIGWYVGYVERKDGVFYFANCIQQTDEPGPQFIAARKDIALTILKKFGVIE